MEHALISGLGLAALLILGLLLYEGVVATPVGVEDVAAGEVMWAVARGSVYSVGFIVVMLALHLVASPWAILAIPALYLATASLYSAASAPWGTQVDPESAYAMNGLIGILVEAMVKEAVAGASEGHD